MRFEFINAECNCELSRKAFVRMLSGALEISEDYTTWNSVDGYNGKNKKYWFGQTTIYVHKEVYECAIKEE